MLKVRKPISAPYPKELRAIDANLAGLLGQRFRIATRLVPIKQALQDQLRNPEREREVITRVCKLKTQTISEKEREAIYHRIMSVTHDLELIEAGRPRPKDSSHTNSPDGELHSQRSAIRQNIDRLDEKIIAALDKRVSLFTERTFWKASRSSYKRAQQQQAKAVLLHLIQGRQFGHCAFALCAVFESIVACCAATAPK